MLRVWVYGAHMGGYWVQSSINKGPFLADFPETWMGFQKLATNCQKLVVFGQNSA